MEREKMTALVQAVQQGKPDAAGELYTAFYSDIYYFINKTVQEPSLAEDLTQDTFLEILETIHKLQEPAAFVTWSRQIAYHRCTGHFKKRRELLADETEDGATVFDTVAEEREEFIPDEALDHQELRGIIQSMVNALPEEQCSAVMLRYFDELSVQDIAQIQGVSEGTVKSRLNYGRKAIQRSVERWERSSGVKLRCVGILPLLLWLSRCARQERNTAKLSELIPGVSLETVSAGVGAGGASATVATSGVGVGAGAVKTGIFAGIGAKIAAVAAAAVLVVGGIAVASGALDKDSGTGGNDGHQELMDVPVEQEDDRLDEKPVGVLSEQQVELLASYYDVVLELANYEKEELWDNPYNFRTQGKDYSTRQMEEKPYLRHHERLRKCYDALLELEEVDSLLADTETLQIYFPELIGVPSWQELMSRFTQLEDVMLAMVNAWAPEDYTVWCRAYDAQGRVCCGFLSPVDAVQHIYNRSYLVTAAVLPLCWDDPYLIPHTGSMGDAVFLRDIDVGELDGWSYTYDDAGRLTQVVIGPEGAVYNMTYDAQGRITSEDASIDGICDRITTYEYDAAGRLVSAESQIQDYQPGDNPDANRFTVSYDETGRPTKMQYETFYFYTDKTSTYTSNFDFYYGDCLGYTPGFLNEYGEVTIASRD